VKDDRRTLIAEALRLEWLTIGWMAIEAIAAVWAGVAAGSLTVTAFGLDSVIELASACVLLWRLTVELRHGREFGESREYAARRTAGGLLFVLAAYILAAAASALWTRQGEAFTWLGLAVALIAMQVMYYLSRRKLALATALDSGARKRCVRMASGDCGDRPPRGLVAKSLVGRCRINHVALDPVRVRSR
jgi:divalent metal cation (Fe/Co/Zn/Cd) transporter